MSQQEVNQIKKMKRFNEVEKRFKELQESMMEDGQEDHECKKALILSKLLNYEMNLH